MEGLQYPFLARQHHSHMYKNNEIHAKQYQMIKNPASSTASSSSSSSPPLIFQQNFEIPKSFDDVWSDIDHDDAMKTYPLPPQETNTNGDITLEEFLICTGAINPTENQEGFVDNTVPLMTASGVDPMLISSWQQERDVQVPMLVQDVMGSNFQGSEDYFEEKMVDLDLKMPVPIISEMGVGCGENFTDLLQGDSDRRKKVCTDEIMKKSIERRQRRMIKNRESAARSRARKQAYTNQLMQNVKKLRTTNILLMKRKLISCLFTGVKFKSNSGTKIPTQKNQFRNIKISPSSNLASCPFK
ncbi:ABSCISIC ACID-INSENSITIVE 5-like protein 3 isoform X1 [Primulina tabacum]|uniref:ABSCISIC ACID-INSENSITIVE 5-like protein 3 isoform X1 n=1 Tax=Primulina tabacum TaxID=48773 RepID=UPI003F5A5E71